MLKYSVIKQNLLAINSLHSEEFNTSFTFTLLLYFYYLIYYKTHNWSRNNLIH